PVSAPGLVVEVLQENLEPRVLPQGAEDPKVPDPGSQAAVLVVPENDPQGQTGAPDAQAAWFCVLAG
ncbi:hypothetical protein WICPIJ_004549, partial [Wickerhamomyces pijperi]